MKAKKTQLLVAELRMIAGTLDNENNAAILREAAERIEDTEKIAEFYRREAERLVVKKPKVGDSGYAAH